MTHTPLNASPRTLEPRTLASVEVLTDEPTRATVAVAALEASGGWRSDYGERIQALRDRAAGLGCDAIVLRGEASDDRLRAMCVVYQ